MSVELSGESIDPQARGSSLQCSIMRRPIDLCACVGSTFGLQCLLELKASSTYAFFRSMCSKQPMSRCRSVSAILAATIWETWQLLLYSRYARLGMTSTTRPRPSSKSISAATISHGLGSFGLPLISTKSRVSLSFCARMRKAKTADAAGICAETSLQLPRLRQESEHSSQLPAARACTQSFLRQRRYLVLSLSLGMPTLVAS